MEERAETSFFHRRTSHEENQTDTDAAERETGEADKTEKIPPAPEAVLLGAVIGWMLDLLEGRWKNDLWKPKG